MTTQEQVLDKAKNYKALTGTPIDDDIIEAFESALTELAEIKQRAEERRNDGNTLLREIELIDYIIEGETK